MRMAGYWPSRWILRIPQSTPKDYPNSEKRLREAEFDFGPPPKGARVFLISEKMLPVLGQVIERAEQLGITVPTAIGQAMSLWIDLKEEEARAVSLGVR